VTFINLTTHIKHNPNPNPRCTKWCHQYLFSITFCIFRRPFSMNYRNGSSSSHQHFHLKLMFCKMSKMRYRISLNKTSRSIITYSWIITLSWEVSSSRRLESFENCCFHHQVFQGQCPPSVTDLHAEFWMLHSQQSKPVSDMRFCNHLIETKEWNIEHNNTYNVWNIHNR